MTPELQALIYAEKIITTARRAAIKDSEIGWFICDRAQKHLLRQQRELLGREAA